MKKKEIRNWVTFASILVLMWGLLFLLDRYVCSSYKILSNSMEPTLYIGNRVFINKLLMGARIEESYDEGFEKKDSFVRLKGRREIRPNDVICFNYPHDKDPISIELNRERIYCKRVLGTPGDRIGAVDGHYWNDKHLRPIGVVQEQNNLRWTYDSMFVWIFSYDVLTEARQGWNIKNWGPITVPGPGVTVTLDGHTRELYRGVIEYETGEILDNSTEKYTFNGNYYFAVGDNVMNSNDSRYWGFIPEEFIIGIVGGRKVRNINRN